MTRISFLIVPVLVLTCATGSFAWFDNFNGYTGGDMSSGWTVPDPEGYDPWPPWYISALSGGWESGGLAATSTWSAGSPVAYAFRLTGDTAGVLIARAFVGTAGTTNGARIGLTSALPNATPWATGPTMDLFAYTDPATGRPVVSFHEWKAGGLEAYSPPNGTPAVSTNWMDLMIVVDSGGSYSASYKCDTDASWIQLVAPRTTFGSWAPDKVWIAPSAHGILDDVGFLPLSTATTIIQGSVTIQDMQSAADKSLVKVRVDLRSHLSVIALQSVILSADTGGNYAYNFRPLDPGQYDLAFSSPGCLRKVITVTVGAGQAVTQNASLMNGDANGDNQVDSTDQAIVQGNLDLVGAQ